MALDPNFDPSVIAPGTFSKLSKAEKLTAVQYVDLAVRNRWNGRKKRFADQSPSGIVMRGLLWAVFQSWLGSSAFVWLAAGLSIDVAIVDPGGLLVTRLLGVAGSVVFVALSVKMGIRCLKRRKRIRAYSAAHPVELSEASGYPIDRDSLRYSTATGDPLFRIAYASIGAFGLLLLLLWIFAVLTGRL